jgi:soluble lytic murein transglycosylase-like protein
MKKVFTLAVLLCLHTPAFAAEPGPPAPLVEAIARQESGLNPLALNIAGKPYYPATREEAEQLIRKAIAAGQSFDVGTMQINSWWMERLALDPLSLLDPATNERWGKWILAEEIARHGLNWKAVGKYHSPDPERGRQYAWLVYRHYAGQSASKIKEAPHAEQKTHTQNVFDSRGTRADQGIGQQSGSVPFHVQQKGVPWVFRPKSGASGGKN